MSPLRRLPPVFLFGLILTGLSACTLFPDREPIQVYVLPTEPVSASSEAAMDASLRLETPRASRSLSGSHILVMPDPQELSSYQGVRWHDRVPALLRDHLIDTFRSDGRLSAVVDDSSRITTRAELVSDLRAFHSEYVNGRPEVVIRLDVQLLDSNSLDLLASRRFDVRVVSEGTDIPMVVKAFGRATDELSGQLLAWSMEQLQAL